MIGLDWNILVQLAFADHPANSKTIAAIQAETRNGEKLVFPSLVVAEFLHVATDTRRFDPPLTMADALDWIESSLKTLRSACWRPTRRVWSRRCTGCGSSTLAANAYSTPNWPQSCTVTASVAFSPPIPQISQSFLLWKPLRRNLRFWQCGFGTSPNAKCRQMPCNGALSYL